jgi:hypothetical protein
MGAALPTAAVVAYKYISTMTAAAAAAQQQQSSS